MSPEGSEGTYLLRIIQRESIYIERTFIALTQEIHRLTVGSPDRVAVFSCTGRQVGMLACFGIIHPDVPRNGRSVMLAPFVFKSLAVLIKKGIPRRIKADQFGRCSQHLFGFSPETGTLYNSVMAEVGNMALAAGSCMLAEKTTYFPSGVKAEGVSAAEFTVSLRAAPPSAGMTNTSMFP